MRENVTMGYGDTGRLNYVSVNGVKSLWFRDGMWSKYSTFLAEGAHGAIELLADARDGALIDADQAERLDQIINLAGADALNVGVLNDGEQCALSAATRLEKARKV